MPNSASQSRAPTAWILLVVVAALLGAWWLLASPESRPQSVQAPSNPLDDASEPVAVAPRDAAPTDRDEITAATGDQPTDEAATVAPPVAASASGPASELRVLHAGSGQHVADLELRLAARYFADASSGIPGDGEPFHLLGRGLDSPIRLRPGVTEGERPQLATLTLAASNRETTASFGSEPPVLHRGFALYARGRGTAWGRIELDLREPANRTLELPGGLDLELAFANWQPERYAAVGLAPRLTVLLQGGSPNQPLDQRRLRDEDGAPPRCELQGLPVGSVLRVLVDLGTRFETEEPIRLADQVVATEPRPDGPVTITLADPPEGRAMATLTARLRLPPFPGRDAAELRLFGPGSSHSEPSASLRLGDMQAAGEDVWDFATELPVGTVQAKLWPLLTSWIVEVPTDGTRAEFAVEAIAEVQVDVLDRRTNRPAEVGGFTWRREEELEGMRNHLASRVRSETPTARFVIHTSPGFLELDVDQDEPPLMGTASCEVHGGTQRVDLVVGAPTGVTVRFRLGDSLLPLDAPGLPDLFLLPVEHDGRQTLDSTRVDGGLQVSAGGRYKLSISFAKDSPYRYAGDEVYVDVLSDRRAPLELELRRK